MSETSKTSQRPDLVSELSELTLTDSEHRNDLAATMIDLLRITQSTDSDDAVECSGPAAEIESFCHEVALPCLRNSESADSEDVAQIRETVESKWGEYLGLLSPSERFRTSEVDWSEDSVDAWDELVQPVDGQDDATASFDDTGFGDTGFDGAESDAPDIGALLSSLSNLSVEPTSSNPAANHPGSSADKSNTGDLPTLPDSVDTINDPELQAAYIDDAQQCLAGMEDSLLRFDANDQPVEAMQQYCRELHTLKGASGTVGLDCLAKYLHQLETYIESNELSALNVDALLAGVDAVRIQLDAVSNGELTASGMASVAAPSQGNQSRSGVSGSVPATAHTQNSSTAETFVRLESSRLDRLMDLLAELVMLRNRRETYVGGLRDLDHELKGCETRIRSLDGHPDDVAPATESSRHYSSALTEIACDVTELSRSVAAIGEPLAEDNTLISHLIGQFRQELMDLRRQPISALFQRLQRAARSAAQAEGKDIKVEVTGQGTRVERATQERLYEPLMHMVRNAVSHGIESVEQRVAAGKSEVGKVTLDSWSDASTLFLEVRDDGRGLDRDAIERKGRERGLLPIGQSVSDAQLFKLIFHPGFSTQSSVSEISGRGIGMDVVDEWVRRLRGRIDVSSVTGEGTAFRLQIPLRSAIEHAMVVRVGKQLFALPMQCVSRTECSKGIPATVQRPLPLSTLLGLPESSETDGRLLSLQDATIRPGENGLLPNSSTKKREAYVEVDAVVGVEEVVVRSLPPMLRQHELFAGVTLSGQAETVLLLDVPHLIDIVESFKDSGNIAYPPQNSTNPGREQATHILIADDSITVRRALARKLSDYGFRTTEVADGAAALKTLSTNSFDALVTDVDMPNMNGMELLSEVRSSSRCSGLPVVVVTSRDDDQTIANLQELGATAVLKKPITDTLVTQIAQAIWKTTRNVSS